MTIVDKDHGLERILREVARARTSHVTVGIHEDAGEHEGVSVAQVGAFHEFGVGVPQRAFLAPTIDDNADELGELAGKLYYGPLLDGNVSTKRALGLIGTKAEALVQQTLRDKRPEWPALSPETKRRKAKKGRLVGEAAASFIGGDGNPLIDTGQMIQSIRHRVEIGKGGVG